MNVLKILFVCLVASTIVLSSATQLDATQSDKTSVQNDLESQLEFLKNTISKLSSESDSIEKNIRKTQEDLEKETQELATTKESLSVKEEELAKSQRYIDSLLEEIESKSKQLELLEDTNADLENKLEQVKSERNSVSEQLATTSARLGADLEETKESLRISREALETASKVLDAAQKDLEERRTTIQSLEGVIREKEAAIQQFSAQKVELQNTAKELQQSEATLRTELENTRKEFQQTETTLRSELAEVRTTCADVVEKEELEEFSDDSLIEFKFQVQADAAEEVLAKYHKEAKELKQFIFQSFAAVLKAKKMDPSSTADVVTPWIFPSADAYKVVLDNYTAGGYPDFSQALRALGPWWYNEDCYNALLNKDFSRALMKQLKLEHQLTVSVARWIVWKYDDTMTDPRNKGFFVFSPEVNYNQPANWVYLNNLTPGQPFYPQSNQIFLYAIPRFQWLTLSIEEIRQITSRFSPFDSPMW